MTDKTRTIRVPIRPYDAAATHEGTGVTELPSTPAALGKMLAGMVQEALDKLPGDGVINEEPSVYIQVAVRREAVDLLQARTVTDYDMNYMTDDRSPTPAELLATAAELLGKKIPRDKITKSDRYPEVIEIEVDVP